MRWVGGLVALALSAAWATLGATAVAIMSAAPVAAESECTNPDALGVSRTIEIDTAGGPWLGAPHGDPNLLEPGEVVLTFDDGPVPISTRKILATLAAECTKATFLMVGQMAKAYPEMVREVVAGGHTVGTHTWSHPNLAQITPSRMQGQIEKAINVVQQAAGTPIAPFFRYPYLSSTGASVAYLKRRGIAQLAIDVDSFDYMVRNPPVMVRRTMARLKARGRGIILMHDIHISTAKALPGLLASLRREGFRVVHLQPKAPVETVEIAEASVSGKASVGEPRPARKRPKAPATATDEGGGAFDFLFK
jgi:peptidoglycan/xylan/chitin deacetylase (PgdA/CDA1 family)